MHKRPRIGWVGIAGVFAFALIFRETANAQSGPWKLTISSRETGFAETPVVLPVREKIPPGIYQVVKSGAGIELGEKVQVFQENGDTSLALDLFSMAPNTTVTLELKPLTKNESAGLGGVLLVPQGTNVAVKLDGELFTEYRTDDGPKPFLYPLIGPTGSPYTRSFPMKQVEGETKDHPHHRSVWFTYGKLNGIDFWAEPKGKPFGRIKETGRKPLIQGPVLGRLRTADDWLGPDGVKVCEDERILTIYDTSSARIFDFDIKIKASNGPVEFGDTKEGMFGLRVASTMDVSKKLGGKIVNSEGLVDDKTWGKPASWVDYSGPVDGKTVGISILNHPSSFRYPTTWHVRTYGLFAANPFGWHDFGHLNSGASTTPGRGDSGTFVLPKGQEIGFRYRVMLHTGDASAAKLPQAFQAYAEPPQISLEKQ